ncbi:MAG TPA: hypothetical protein P5534_06455 [Candidatus Paceibacterota bacterium]|nr:hypothetical protein [Candidatus Paceibacterota bacterium]HRZ56784.1 hypothetical protein [Candidatus Paceibacterota bacterium]
MSGIEAFPYRTVETPLLTSALSFVLFVLFVVSLGEASSRTASLDLQAAGSPSSGQVGTTNSP